MRPIFIDLETRSTCDLKVEGGFNYAKHPDTRLMTVAWRDGSKDHVWLPGLRNLPSAGLLGLHLPDVQVHVGHSVPGALCATRRPWVGHNCWTFDRPVWIERTPADAQPVRWIDTYPLALAAGLPGGLDAIGKALWGEGKYEKGAHELKKGFKATSSQDCDPENVPLGRILLIAKYNVQDVRLLANLWDVLVRECKLPASELAVLKAHDAINDRGCRIDRPLVKALITLSSQAQTAAVKKIAEITEGALSDLGALQSRNTMLKWLDNSGFGRFKDTGLRKEVVARFIDAGRAKISTDTEDAEDEKSAPAAEVDCEDDPDAKIANPDLEHLSRVVNVLELRMQALRITGGKLDSALWATDRYTDRCRGLFAYWAAHTGRWGGRRVQVQNLPRPKEGIDTWALIALYEDWTRHQEHSEEFCYDTIHRRLPLGERDVEGRLLYPYLSVDDAASGLLRGIFLPDGDEDDDALAAGDFAAIEARVLDWCAGGSLGIFWDQGDPYMEQAELIFGPRDKWKKFPDPKEKGAFLPLKKHPYRQVGKVVVLGSGYQLGAAKFAVYAAANGIDLSIVDTTPAECIHAYRASHPLIAGEYQGLNDKGKPIFRGGLWHDLNQAVLSAVRDGVRARAGRCVFQMEGEHLICTLPSGRRLTYRKAIIEDIQDRVPWDSKGRAVEAVSYLSPRYGRKYLYGGVIAENIVQAISRDILGASIVRIEEHGNMPVVLHCHDEAVSSTKFHLYDSFMGRLTTCPDWLDKFPLDAEGGLMPRYSKTVPPGRKEQVWRNGKFLKSA